jgi:hypothetical protein
MATTAKGTPYVESSDLVADYPTVSLALAEHIDDNTGKVLQVVSATHSTAVGITGTTFADIGLSATITPTASNNKIMVLCSALADARSSGAQSGARLKILRAATTIHEGLLDGDIFLNAATSASLTIITGRITPMILDSPATTSATTYNVQGCGAQADDTATFQRNSNTSYLILMEVSA